jgi:hypothetical protein
VTPHAVAAEHADPASIVRALARPAPSAVQFIELRDSALLKQALQVSGEYRRPDNDTLVREVHAPYHETATLRAGMALIEREGKPPQHFEVSRVPELSALQISFGALLAGDLPALQAHYQVQALGSSRHWTLRLTPLDPALGKRVQALALYGDGAQLRCIETRPARGQPQRTLLGTVAAPLTAATIADSCRGNSPPAP